MVYPDISKLSFQYGFRVFLMTDVVRVCSPPIVATANGSGNPTTVSRHIGRVIESKPTEDITLIEAVCCDDYSRFSVCSEAQV